MQNVLIAHGSEKSLPIGTFNPTGTNIMFAIGIPADKHLGPLKKGIGRQAVCLLPMASVSMGHG